MENEIELADFFSILWQKKIIIIITTIIFMIIGFSGSVIIENIEKNQNTQEISKMYYAQTTFLVATSQISTTTIEQPLTNSIPVNITGNEKNTINDITINTYNSLVKSQTILNNIKNKLNLTEDLYDLISVSQVNNSNLIAINVAYHDEQKVLQIADELMNEFVQNMSQTYFIDAVSIIDKAYLLSNKDIANIFKEYIISEAQAKNDLTNMLRTLQISTLIPKKELQNIFEEYIFTDKNIEELNIDSSLKDILQIDSSNIIIYTIFSTIFGFIISTSIILVVDIFNKTIKSENNISGKILASIKYNGTKNIFDILRIKLENNKLILINNLDNANENSYITDNLATAFTNIQNKTLLIDLASNTNLVEKSSEKNLFDLIKDKPKKIDSYISKSTINNLDILVSGNIDNTCKESDFKGVLSNLEKSYDYIIINSNNVLENANSLQIFKLVKNTILVAIQGKSKINDYNKFKESISEINGNFLGTILLKK